MEVYDGGINMKSLNELFAALIFANECSSNEKFIYRFSDPDGVRSGKSGWSFGRVQWDTRNNSMALDCLSECGFTQDQIDGVVDQTIDVKPLAAILKANAAVIDRFDQAQLSICINQALNWNATHNIPITDTGAILAAADYWNQYGSQGECFAAYLMALHRPVIAQDILDFKLEHTKYGKEHSDDCRRRFDNLIHILDKEGVVWKQND
jgi:hypothetical protein